MNRQKYSYNDVYDATLKYFNGDDLATNVWISKYCKKELIDNDIIYYELTPDDMFHRIAKEISRAGNKYDNPLTEDQVYNLIKDFKYIVFQGRPMAGIGVDDAVSISNCFVVGKPDQDSYGTIALIDQEIMQLSKRGGGVGTDLSAYRPNGAKVRNAALTSSGPVNICANRFSNTIREVGQNGRRGALMLSMDVTHPSIEEFIDSKMEEGKITGANISVKLYDNWIKEALGIDTKVDNDKKRLWDKIIHNATTKAEPGVLFWDTVLRESVPDCYKDFGFKTISTNPCFPGSEMLLTDNGYFSFKELYDKNIPIKVITDNRVSYVQTKNVESADQWHIDNNKIGITVRQGSEVFLTKKNANIIELYFDNGKCLRCTPDHHIATKNRGMVEAQYLLKNEEVLTYDSAHPFDINYRYSKFIEYKNIGNEDVYCIKEPITRSIIVNGFVTRRCGEITLSDCDSCRLMVINLFSYVNNPFTSSAKFDYDLFSTHVRLLTKMMDNMIDLELEKIDKIINKIKSDPEDEETKAIELNLWKKIKKTCELGRRAGIGITGEGDMLAAMGLTYGTPEATEFSKYVQNLLALNAYIESCDLVQQENRPKFGCYDYELEKNNPFLLRLSYINNSVSDPYLHKILNNFIVEFKEKWTNGKGRRNIALLTIAPTGSISCLTQTTSGIEPVFKISYTRRRKIDKSSGINPDFIDKTGDWFINFNVVHNKFILWYSIYKNITFDQAKDELEKLSEDKLNDLIKESPYYKATAMDCDWMEKVKMQGALQKYVDHSISVTINLPKGTSEETVSNLYKLAWESGCKGCTIYVDGSRDGVLISKNEKSKCKEFLEKNAPKRPKRLPCKIVRFVNKGEKWIAAVGLYEDKPYEIFSGLAEKLNIPSNASNIYIVRNKVSKDIMDEDTGMIQSKLVSRYDVEYTDEEQNIKTIEGLSTIFNKEYWNLGKMISGLLRHSMPLEYIIKVINSLKLDDGINSWKNGVIRTLKQFTKDEQTGDICPNCGEKLWRVSGCIECKNCGYSKCG